MEYEFVFVVEGVSADDETVGVIFGQFDGLLAVAAGQTLLSVSESGDNPVDAAPGQISAGVLRLRGLGPRVEPRLLARYWDEGGRDILVRIQGVARGPAQDPHGLYWKTPSERWRSVNKSCT